MYIAWLTDSKKNGYLEYATKIVSTMHNKYWEKEIKN